MTKKRRTFNATEKAKIALEAIRSELTMAQISSKYSVHAGQINKWKKQALEQLPAAFTNQAKKIQTDHEAEIKQLYEQIGRLNIENQFLKKKCEVFT